MHPEVTYLSLAWFQPVHQAGDGTFIIQVREQNELLVDKVGVSDSTSVLLIEVNIRQPKLLAPLTLLHPSLQPLLTLLHCLFAECLQDDLQTQ